MFEKIDVNGENCHDVYNFLKSNSELFDKETKETKDITWNFVQFLVNKKGEVVGYWDEKSHPVDIRPDIEKMIKY